MRIAIFGGSFNPPTPAHIEIIRYLRNTLQIDKIVILPCGMRQDKPDLIDGHHRVSMIKTACQNSFGEEPLCYSIYDPSILLDRAALLIDEFEIVVNKKMMPTADLLRKYHHQSPGHDIHFVLGADLLQSIHTWEDYDSVLLQHRYIIFARSGYQLELYHPIIKNSIVIDDHIFYDVSSTKIRFYLQLYMKERQTNSLKRRMLLKKLSMLIDRQVLDYIIYHQLYGVQEKMEAALL